MNKPEVHISTKGQLWYPVHRRWLFLFRIFAGIGAVAVFFRTLSGSGFSLSLSLLVLWFFVLQPEIRPQTPFYYCGIVAHWLFFALMFILIIVALLESLHLA